MPAAPPGGVGPTGALRRRPFAYIYPPDATTLRGYALFDRNTRAAAAIADKFRGTEVSVPAPSRDGEVPPEPSPSPLLIPREFDIKPSSHPRGEKDFHFYILCT